MIGEFSQVNHNKLSCKKIIRGSIEELNEDPTDLENEYNYSRPS